MVITVPMSKTPQTHVVYDFGKVLFPIPFVGEDFQATTSDI